MIPNIDILTSPIESKEYPNRTYKAVFSNVDFNKNDVYKNRINGYTDDLDALKQTIYLILNTERYKFPIYSWDYGVELYNLFGKPMPYVLSELPRRIKDALLVDNRITDVTDFEFEQNGKKLLVKFTVISTIGNISSEVEVTI